MGHVRVVQHVIINHLTEITIKNKKSLLCVINTGLRFLPIHCSIYLHVKVFDLKSHSPSLYIQFSADPHKGLYIALDNILYFCGVCGEEYGGVFQLLDLMVHLGRLDYF